MGGRAFSYQAPLLWNQLPVQRLTRHSGVPHPRYKYATARGSQDAKASVGVISSSPPNIEIWYTIGTRAADLRERIMKSWGNSTTSLPRLTHKVPDESLLEDMNRALSKEATHNSTAQWLQDLQAEHSQLPEQDPVVITLADIQTIVSKMKSWTAPGPDNIHAYWLKKLTALHERLAAQMNQLLTSGDHPEWLTQGPTVLIMKDPQKGTILSNYWPITCLSTTWKLLSGIIVAKISRHMD
ncbi:hypothetical protein D4764_06G0008130 [Takifugu flavidus]|uniref:Uncharacterized protein n=1 Tax=Takifugu flavidus TaxID=433684 RepID=A0A5C6MWA0_9TELE|nr:hypothetical protein D4764_06G0008130 [Takifugu flavidus]